MLLQALLQNLSLSVERSEEIDRMLNIFIKDVNISGIILKLLGKAAHVMEDVMYIILFLIFMLAHNPSPSDDGSSSERGDGGGGGGGDAGDSARLGRKFRFKELAVSLFRAGHILEAHRCCCAV